ncbi:MAG: DEAD/DEAH box helicase family protein, partial [Clostridia bacterium]
MTVRYLSEKFTQQQTERLFTTKGKIQMITAPTGAGKTYFVQNNVIKIAKGEFKPFGASQKKALLLANRSALITQIREDLNNNLDSMYFENIHEEEYVTKYIDILSYQSLARKILEDITFLEKYNLIIADECHYFLNDYWNNTTQLTLNKLINHSKDNTVLFFSATTEELKSFMDTMKDIEFKGRELYNEVLNLEEGIDLGFNDRLDIVVTNDSLENVMLQIPEGEKFIIFVNEFMKKNKIEELVEIISTDKRAIGFMYSKWEQQGKGFKINEEMAGKYDLTIKNESFYNDYIIGLVANNAIDNGVNLKMEDLKHIILLNQYDFTQIKQFIGRKRHNPNNIEDRTSVYIISHNKSELQSIKSKYDKTMEYWKDYETLTKEEFMN